jgi:site-specific DNA-methyltransferase (adenine-specific)
LAIMRDLPSESVDAIITDPPYSSGALHAAGRTQQSPRAKYQSSDTKLRYADFAGDNRDQRSWAYWSVLWLTEALRIANVGAPVLMFCDWRQLPTATDVMQAAGAVWRGIFPWLKPSGRPSGPGRFRNGSEFVVWGSKGTMPPREEIGYLPGYHVESIRKSDKHHLTGKPTELMRVLCRICPPDGVILDPFTGSGTTGVAALQEGRRFIGIEMTSENAAVARQRLDAVDCLPMAA